MREADRPALVAGLALVAVGGVLVAGGEGWVSLSFATVAPVMCAAIGAMLLAHGLSRGS